MGHYRSEMGYEEEDEKARHQEAFKQSVRATDIFNKLVELGWEGSETNAMVIAKVLTQLHVNTFSRRLEP